MSPWRQIESTAGASRLNTLQAGSTWFDLPPATASVIQFESADTSPVSATLQVEYASSFSSAT